MRSTHYYKILTKKVAIQKKITECLYLVGKSFIFALENKTKVITNRKR